MITFTVGISSEHDPFQAGKDAAKDALERLDGKTPIGGLVFISVAFDQDRFLAGVTSILPNVPIAGGSTAGEISTEGLARTGSGVVALITSDQCSIVSSAVHHLGANAHGSGVEFARLSHSLAPSARDGLLFFDPFVGDVASFFSGYVGMGGDVPSLVGAATADDLLYRETYQYRDKAAHTRSATALLFSGSYKIAVATTQGFIPIGMPTKVTRSIGNTVLSIAGEPAVELYRSYFGARHMDLLSTSFPETTSLYPLGIRTTAGHVVQIPTALTKEGGLQFLRHVPEGSEVRLMVGDTEGTVGGAREAAREILQRMGGRPLRGALVFCSFARRSILGSRADEEIRAIQDVIGPSVPIAGMYGYAEVLPETPYFSQATMTLWGIAE